MGFQLMVVEYVRYILYTINANSVEYQPDVEHPVTQKMSDFDDNNYGGTMRLGVDKIIIEPDSMVYNLYKSTEIYERHRHRYEINPKYVELINNHNLDNPDRKFKLKFVGSDKTKTRMEILELGGHKFFVGCQYHPELKSRFNNTNPLFDGLLDSID